MLRRIDLLMILVPTLTVITSLLFVFGLYKVAVPFSGLVVFFLMCFIKVQTEEICEEIEFAMESDSFKG